MAWVMLKAPKHQQPVRITSVRVGCWGFYGLGDAESPQTPTPRTYHAEGFSGKAEPSPPAPVAAAAAGRPDADDVLHAEHHDHDKLLRWEKQGETRRAGEAGRRREGLGVQKETLDRGDPRTPLRRPPVTRLRAPGAGQAGQTLGPWQSRLSEQSSPPTCAKLKFSRVLFLLRQHCPPTSRTNKPPFCLLGGKSQGPSRFSPHRSHELRRQPFLTLWGKVAFFSPSCPALPSGVSLPTPPRGRPEPPGARSREATPQRPRRAGTGGIATGVDQRWNPRAEGWEGGLQGAAVVSARVSPPPLPG